MKEYVNATWPKIKTTRRYINCPKAERMYTIWAEGKVIFGEIVVSDKEHPYGTCVFCSGVWFVHGEENNAFDFRECKNIVMENGIPVHGLAHSFSGIDVNIETFSDIGRKPNCYVKVSLCNNSKETITDKFGFLLRTGLEVKLVNGAPDLYNSYSPDIAVWKEHENTWNYENSVFRDGETFVSCKTDLPVSFDNGTANFDIELAPNETKEIYLVIGKGETVTGDYDCEKAKAISFWEGELAKINKLPQKLLDDKKLKSMVYTLAVQIMQNFCYYTTSDFLVLKQGGLQRRLWNWEAMFGLKALGLIGDFGDYIEPVLDFYFNETQTDEGEVLCLGMPWANATAASLQSLMDYSKVAGKEFYEKYRDNAIAAFNWIKTTRAKSATMEGLAAGIFPELRGTDSPSIFQNWSATDTANLDSLRVFYETAESFGDSFADTVKAEYTDYRDTARKYFKEYSKSLGDAETARHPLTPFGNTEELLKSYSFEGLGFARFQDIIVDDEYELERVIKFYIENDRFAPERGLHAMRLKGRTGIEPHIWYTSNSEYYLFRFYMRHNMPEKALAQIECNIRYAMSDEYYMVERYSDKDEYYAPWMPNVSASGRLIEMLCEYYK